MDFDLSTVQHHHALEEIVDVLCNRTHNDDKAVFRMMAAYFLGKVASSMRATVVTADDKDGIPVNVYCLALAPSGFSKGKTVYTIENTILKKFAQRFTEDTFPMIAEQNLMVIANKRAARKGTDQQEEFNKVMAEFDRLGAYLFNFDSGTAAGAKQLRDKLLMADIGSINLQIDEIGLNLTSNADLLGLFLELYDQGMVKQKLTKHTSDNPRLAGIIGKTPTNLLMFGVPSMLLDGGETEKQFYKLLETGYARRCIFAQGQTKRTLKTMTPKEALKRLTQASNNASIQKWSDHFYQLADPTMYNWKMEVPDDVHETLLAYRMECENQADEMGEHEEIRKTELSHRYFKALKLAGIYAFIDKSMEVEEGHLLSAIKLVEESGASFQEILAREKSYVKLAKYIASVGSEVTHADLHESLPFYRGSQNARNDLISLATSWGIKKNIVIKRYMADGIEYFKGETLQETDLSRMIVSYSNHEAYHYLNEMAPFEKLHQLTQHDGLHWCTHHFKDGHRTTEKVIPGFNMIVIDVDDGIRADMAAELMKDYKFLLYTTKRHTEDHHRFRMIFPIKYHLELEPGDYREFMNHFLNWLPFQVDTASNQIAKKWLSHAGGNYGYNLEGELIDVLDFIPKTKRNEQYQKDFQPLENLDNVERWFAARIMPGNRNNQMIRYALFLLDSGWDLVDIRRQVHAFNSKLANPLPDAELDNTVMVTVVKKANQKQAA